MMHIKRNAKAVAQWYEQWWLRLELSPTMHTFIPMYY